MTEHRLKTLAHYWDAVADGNKPFEVRRNDRGFQTGDVLVLERWEVRNGIAAYPTNKVEPIRRKITYLLQGGQLGIEPGFCVLGLGV